MKKNKLLSEVSSVTLEYMNMHISKTLFTYLKMRKEDRLKGAKKGRSPGTKKTPLNVPKKNNIKENHLLQESHTSKARRFISSNQ